MTAASIVGDRKLLVRDAARESRSTRYRRGLDHDEMHWAGSLLRRLRKVRVPPSEYGPVH